MSRRRFSTVILFALAAATALLANSSSAFADDPVAGWVTSPLYPLVSRLAEDYRILLIPDPDSHWTRAEIESLFRGAEVLPPAIVDALEEPVRIRRVHHECMFGVGRYTQRCPAYDDEDNFLLYDLPPIQGEGPVERLAPLDAVERRDIQRRRAVVHAVMLAYDWEEKWSQSKRWKAINGWRTTNQPFNRDMWGYSRYLGYRSPRLDFVTFAEEWFVRPIDVVDPDGRERIDPDMSVDCQEFTKSRFLAEKLVLLDPTWHPPARHERPPDQQCPAFESWARLDQLQSIDLLTAAATADRPESLYGHLLLHLRYKDRSEGFEPVYQFGAVTDTNVAPMTYFSRGLLGGFLSVIELNSFRSVDRLFLQYEQRGLRRYELRLSPRQTRRLMERIWEYERRVRYPYHFFANNCASFLIDLIGPALELDVPNRSRIIVSPTDVLDYLAAVDNPGRGTLLVKRPEVEFSSREVAQAAVKKRRETLQRLLHSMPTSEARADEIRDLDRELDSRDPDERRDAYDRLRQLLVEGLAKQSPATVEDAIDYLYYSSSIERYFAEVAFYREREIKAAAVEDPRQFTAEELLSRRRTLYAHEDADRRFETLLEWTETVEKRNLEGERRPYTRKEDAELERVRRTEAAYMAALDAQSTVIDHYAPDFDGVAYVEAKRERLVAEQARRDRYAVGPSGKGRLAVGGGASSMDVTELAGSVGLLTAQYSFIYERLGEQRRRGFRSDIESRAIGAEIYVPTVARPWENLDLDVTLFRFLTVEQKLGPIRRGFFDSFGWGTDIRGGHDGRRDLDVFAGLSGGLLLPVFQTDHAANHLVLGLFGDARIDLGAQGRRIMTGGDGFARFLIHLGGVYTNSLRLEAGTRHWFAAETLSHEWEHRARLATEHALFFVGQYPFVLSPWIQTEWTSVDYADTDDFLDIRAGLSFELPL